MKGTTVPSPSTVCIMRELIIPAEEQLPGKCVKLALFLPLVEMACICLDELV
jgi:hypothetical protein